MEERKQEEGEEQFQAEIRQKQDHIGQKDNKQMFDKTPAPEGALLRTDPVGLKEKIRHYMSEYEQE